jgi:Icc-related predicted phosphoesterase
MPYAQGLVIDTISDTHNRHKKLALPGGDILIHAGDMSGRGEKGEILPFLDWYADQDYSHLILVPGNHDFGFERNPELWAACCKDRNIVLLNDSGCEIEGIQIWGSAVQPEFCNWAFNRTRGDEIDKHWQMIPENTEILITHGPPLNILDDANARGYSNHVGCYDLAKRIRQLKSIKLHVFGHIHEGSGYKYLNGCTYVNASTLDGMYIFQAPGFKRVVKDAAGEYFVENLSTEETP